MVKKNKRKKRKSERKEKREEEKELSFEIIALLPSLKSKPFEFPE